MPQLVLSMPLAIGAATRCTRSRWCHEHVEGNGERPSDRGLRTVDRRVACALAVLAVVEAFAIWQWWQPQALADPMHFSRTSEHFTVNLAIAGSLLLLPLRGSGKYTLDQLIKKID